MWIQKKLFFFTSWLERWRVVVGALWQKSNNMMKDRLTKDLQQICFVLEFKWLKYITKQFLKNLWLCISFNCHFEYILLSLYSCCVAVLTMEMNLWIPEIICGVSSLNSLTYVSVSANIKSTERPLYNWTSE